MGTPPKKKYNKKKPLSTNVCKECGQPCFICSNLSLIYLQKTYLTNEVGIYNDYQTNEQHCKQNNETDHTVLNNSSFPLNSEYFAMQEHTDTFTL